MISNVYDVKVKPVYDKDKLLGWEVIYLADMDNSPMTMAYSRFFKRTWYRNSYRAACRAQAQLLELRNGKSR